ncbi:MAG: glycosyltransferase family 4 protein [Lachnospiraceae bacterium]|nr:glycosyltransferase family 4 protein [Lachnospiraceae bacterium]
MRFLIVNKFLYPNGGSETYIFGLGRQLQAMGHEVQYFGMEHPDRCVGNSVNAYTSNMDFHGGSKLSKLTYPIKTIYSIEARRKIRLVLDDFCPDVVHLNNFTYQITPSVILEIVKWRKENKKDCKIIFTAHDYNLICPNHMLNNPNTGTNCEKCFGGHFANCAKGRCIHGSFAKSIVGMTEGYYWKWRKVYRYIDTVICCSEFMKSKMDTNPIFQGRTIAIHNFIEKSESKASNKEAYVLYFGRFAKEKGVLTLLEAIKRLPDISFVFAGSGPLEAEVKAYADIHENVRFVGFKTGDGLKELISKATFSVYPSEWYENCPFSVMESINLGTPVLGSDIGGIPELVDSCGHLFKPGDIADLSNKLRSMWSDRELLGSLTDNCNKNDFDSLENYAKKIIDLI